MPTLARRDVVDESVVGTYHVFGRRARQDFLLGRDPISGRDFSHRKELLLTRLLVLESVFAVECLDGSVLDNHFHLILRNRPDLVAGWTDAEVVERWLLLHRAQLELRKPPTAERIAGLVADQKELRKIRARLSSLSWFMAYFREPLARVFNVEDDKAGHF